MRARGRNDVAEQARRRNLSRSRQRRNGESGGSKNPEHCGECERRRVYAEIRRDRQRVSIKCFDDEGQNGAERHARCDRARRNRHHLQKEDEEDQPTIRAERFERGDLRALAVEECADRLSRADAAHGQRRQPH